MAISTVATTLSMVYQKHNIVAVEAFNNTHFLLISSSEKYGEGQYHQRTIQLEEEDLGFFVEALSIILGELTHGKLSEVTKMEVVKDPARMKAIAEYDRPREKLHALGADKLSHAELLAVLLCTGSSELSVLDLCKRIMKSVKNEPTRLLSRTADDFCKFPGIGVAKAATLLAALELGRRAYPAGQ